MQTWSGLINIGIVHPMIYPETMLGEGPIIETVSKIASDEFFGAIEVSWMKDPEVRSKVADLLRTAFIDIVYCGGPPILVQKLNINALEENIRVTSVKNVMNMVDEAYSLGARIIAILSGPNIEQAKREKAKFQLVKSLGEVCKYAQEKSKNYTLMVSLENFDQEYDKKLLIGPTKEAVEVIEKVKSKYDNIGLTVDLSHLPLLNETSKLALTMAKPYLEHIHIGKCVMKNKSHPQYGDQHPRFSVPEGENSVEELIDFLRALKEVGYYKRKTATRLPVVSFEVKPATDESSEILIANSKRVFEEAWLKI